MPDVDSERGRTVLTRHVVPLSGLVARGLDVPTALLALRDTRGLAALDSAGGAPRRWSIVAFDPLEDLTYSRDDGRDLADVDRALGRLSFDGDAPPGPFGGGFVGALAYELGVRGERLDLPPPAWPQPVVAGGLYGDWIAIEHAPDGSVADADLVLSSGTGVESIESRSRELLDRLEGAVAARGATDPAAYINGEPAFCSGAASRHVEPEEHRARIERVREFIGEGEVYQANLAHRLTATVEADALELYAALRESNPAPYMGYLDVALPDGARGAVVSSSPELLVEIGANGTGQRVARTRPIKGTAGRGATPAEDAARRAALLASEKDRAELAMIVDLERNDLGRVAVPGGVEVSGFPTLESYASVHHLVADVQAILRDDVSALDVLASLFPGGSITGAPKLRSMEVIAELEREGRGFFTGTLGFAGADGRAAFNILIRTLVHRTRLDGTREVSFHVGGGITWGSDPADEDRETMLKAEGMLAALRRAESAPGGSLAGTPSGDRSGTPPGVLPRVG